MAHTIHYPPAYFIASVITMIGLSIFAPGPRIIPFPWSFLGILPFVLGAVLDVRADRVVRTRETDAEDAELPSSLVTNGVFRISRNPMYLGFALMLLGLAMCLGYAIPFLVVPVVVLVLQVVFVRDEERILEGKFGDTWSTYKREVRRWV
jgi:protein-S-isoprenylcysteine O-methyltransferase Ste14